MLRLKVSLHYFEKFGQKGFSKYKLKPRNIKTYCKYKTNIVLILPIYN